MVGIGTGYWAGQPPNRPAPALGGDAPGLRLRLSESLSPASLVEPGPEAREVKRKASHKR